LQDIIQHLDQSQDARLGIGIKVVVQNLRDCPIQRSFFGIIDAVRASRTHFL
jgi:hypothetical protein